MEKKKILKEIACYKAACEEILRFLQSSDCTEDEYYQYDAEFYGKSNTLHNLKEKLRILEEMEKVN